MSQIRRYSTSEVEGETELGKSSDPLGENMGYGRIQALAGRGIPFPQLTKRWGWLRKAVCLKHGGAAIT